ncbi:MAG: hypothetical protein M3Q06_01895, partial [Bacteroidota bacterium]|nr:hypothetical protein [Bacteroidota bacterium]
IMQMMMDFIIFVLQALAFFGQLLLSVLLGRLQRILFNLPVSRKQADTLYCLLNNSFFSIAALLSFFLRMGTQYEKIKDTGTESGIYVLCFFVSFLFVGWWSVKFARLHKLPAGKQFGFHLFSIVLLTCLYGIGMSAICAFVLGT